VLLLHPPTVAELHLEEGRAGVDVATNANLGSVAAALDRSSVEREVVGVEVGRLVAECASTLDLEDATIAGGRQYVGQRRRPGGRQQRMPTASASIR